MGWYTHLSVIMPCDDNDIVAKIAKESLPLLDKEFGSREADWYLEELSKRSGSNPGPKGGLSLWGMVSNHADGEAFCKTLIPFWDKVISEEGGPLYFESVNVFYEEEQSEATIVFEIRRKGREMDGEIEIINHGCMPFQFHQM